MAGATDEVMAQAVEAASHVIVFVSKDYKESANCRMEAKYTNQLSKKGKVKPIFVMVQNEYTTVSTPEYVDGWLGIMIGDSLWYPMWSESQIDSTAQEIAKVLGNEAKLNYTPAPSSTPTSNAQSGAVDYNSAFALLKDHNSATDAHEIDVKLNDFGVQSAGDLQALDKEDIIELSELLKKVQKKKFLTFLKIV
jgi:hypothetical protein